MFFLSRMWHCLAFRELITVAVIFYHRDWPGTTQPQEDSALCQALGRVWVNPYWRQLLLKCSLFDSYIFRVDLFVGWLGTTLVRSRGGYWLDEWRRITWGSQANWNACIDWENPLKILCSSDSLCFWSVLEQQVALHCPSPLPSLCDALWKASTSKILLEEGEPDTPSVHLPVHNSGNHELQQYQEFCGSYRNQNFRFHGCFMPNFSLWGSFSNTH